MVQLLRQVGELVLIRLLVPRRLRSLQDHRHRVGASNNDHALLFHVRDADCEEQAPGRWSSGTWTKIDLTQKEKMAHHIDKDVSIDFIYDNLCSSFLNRSAGASRQSKSIGSPCCHNKNRAYDPRYLRAVYVLQRAFLFHDRKSRTIPLTWPKLQQMRLLHSSMGPSFNPCLQPDPDM